jgi:hypothetical protein
MIDEEIDMMAKAKPVKPGATEAQDAAEVLDAARSYGLTLERCNVGLALDAAGRAVRFGVPGDPDGRGIVPIGPNRVWTLAADVKDERFDPAGCAGPRPSTSPAWSRPCGGPTPRAGSPRVSATAPTRRGGCQGNDHAETVCRDQ